MRQAFQPVLHDGWLLGTIRAPLVSLYTYASPMRERSTMHLFVDIPCSLYFDHHQPLKFCPGSPSRYHALLGEGDVGDGVHKLVVSDLGVEVEAEGHGVAQLLVVRDLRHTIGDFCFLR